MAFTQNNRVALVVCPAKGGAKDKVEIDVTSLSGTKCEIPQTVLRRDPDISMLGTLVQLPDGTYQIRSNGNATIMYRKMIVGRWYRLPFDEVVIFYKQNDTYDKVVLQRSPTQPPAGVGATTMTRTASNDKDSEQMRKEKEAKQRRQEKERQERERQERKEKEEKEERQRQHRTSAVTFTPTTTTTTATATTARRSSIGPQPRPSVGPQQPQPQSQPDTSSKKRPYGPEPMPAAAAGPQEPDSAEPATKKQKVPNCDKCDGPHETDACPHFKKARETHKDAHMSRNGNVTGLASENPPSKPRRGRILRQPGDGACMFHSVAAALNEHPHCRGRYGWNASSLRGKVSNWIYNNATLELAENTVEDWIAWESGLSVQTYAQNIRRGTAWGGGIELAICTMIFQVDIHVYEQLPNGLFERISLFRGSTQRWLPKIDLRYWGRVHYDGLELF